MGTASNAQRARDRYQSLIPKIKAWREEGQTLDQIAARLNEQKYKTRPTKRCPDGGAFTAKMIARLIDRYIGKESKSLACAACN